MREDSLIRGEGIAVCIDLTQWGESSLVKFVEHFVGIKYEIKHLSSGHMIS